MRQDTSCDFNIFLILCFIFSDRQQLTDKASVEDLKDQILSALCWQNRSSPILMSKVLTKLAELRSINDLYAKFLTFVPPKSPSVSDSDREFSATECYEDRVQLPATVFTNHKIAVA